MRSVSEGELQLFPLLEIESNDVILARASQGADCQTVEITFRRWTGKMRCFHLSPIKIQKY